MSNAVIAIVSSPLQLAVFNASSVDKAQATIIGNRGVDGDISYEQSVLNDGNFIAKLSELIGSQEVEVFIPNSLNLVYFFAISDKRIKRISFVDEGRLTKRFLANGHKKPIAKHHRIFSALMRMVGIFPKPLRPLCYKFITYVMRKYVVQFYERDTLAYPYRTIERTQKSGVLLSHVPLAVMQSWVEFVDLTEKLDFPQNCMNQACLFLHPRYAEDPALIGQLQRELGGEKQKLLVRPHPNFTRAPELLEEVIARIKHAGIECEIVGVSGVHEVAIELYARGVRTFFCGETSITDTVEAYPGYFEGLKIVKI